MTGARICARNGAVAHFSVLSSKYVQIWLYHSELQNQIITFTVGGKKWLYIYILSLYKKAALL